MRTFSLLQDTSWIAMDMDSEFKLGFYGPLCTNLLASLGQALAWIFQRKFALSKALIVTEIGAKRDPATLDIFSGNICRLLAAQAHGVRIIGSSTLALCLVASGAAEGYYQYGLHCWDIAAADIIIREAGGCVLDTTGGPLDLMSRRVVAAGTLEIANQIIKQLQPISYERDDTGDPQK